MVIRHSLKKGWRCLSATWWPNSNSLNTLHVLVHTASWRHFNLTCGKSRRDTGPDADHCASSCYSSCQRCQGRLQGSHAHTPSLEMAPFEEENKSISYDDSGNLRFVSFLWCHQGQSKQLPSFFPSYIILFCFTILFQKHSPTIK